MLVAHKYQSLAIMLDVLATSQVRIKRKGESNREASDIPTHDPPPGYVCYRCQKKGHWIQACPTNDDPDFKPAARAKRTTGIPRSFLKTVEKPADGDLEDARGIMLNAEGEYVQVDSSRMTPCGYQW